MSERQANGNTMEFVNEKVAELKEKFGKIEDKHIEFVTARISKKTEDGEDVYLDFAYPTAKTLKGVELLAGSSEELVKFFNQAWTATCQAGVRQKLTAEVQGPEKKILSAAKTLLKTGVFGSGDAGLERAIAAVRATMESAKATA